MINMITASLATYTAPTATTNDMKRDLSPYRKAILEAAARFGVEEVRVFGSQARGDARADSDLDLLIRLAPESASWENYIGFVHSVEDLLGTPVDIITESGMSPHMRPYILAEARPL